MKLILEDKKNWVNIIFNFSNDAAHARAKLIWLNVPVFYLICSMNFKYDFTCESPI